jgi:hypothetical protein
VKKPAYRIYFRTAGPFIVTLSVTFLAALSAIAFIDTGDSSRFTLVLPTLVSFALAYFLHKASLSWIRIAEDGKGIVSVPSWYGRKLWGEHLVRGRVADDSQLLFCRKSAYGAFDGYYVILRTPGSPDVMLWTAESGISRRTWERVANEVREVHRLNCRLIRQVVGNEGTQETEWTAKSDRIRWENVKWIGPPSVFAWLGIPARLFTGNLWAIILVGVMLWIVGFSLFWHFFRTHEVAKGQGLAATTLVWTVQFVALFAVMALVTNAFLHR